MPELISHVYAIEVLPLFTLFLYFVTTAPGSLPCLTRFLASSTFVVASLQALYTVETHVYSIVGALSYKSRSDQACTPVSEPSDHVCVNTSRSNRMRHCEQVPIRRLRIISKPHSHTSAEYLIVCM
jgi:hypothetical protein